MEELRFNGEVAVVTGAGRGLGRAHAELLARRGAAVVVNDVGGALDGARDGGDDPAAQAVAAIRAHGGEAVADHSDISTPEGAEALVAAALAAFGRVDVVVNNAGILRDRAFANMAVQDVEAVLAVHLLGAMWTIRAAWPHFRSQGGGRVVNTTSVAGYLGNFGQANYGAAKMGVVGLTKVLAIEGARHGIKVNAVAPGARTRMNEELLGADAPRLGPERVSPAVAFLAHASCPVSGEVLVAGGGRVARLVIAQTPGLYRDELTPEDVAAHWDEVTGGELLTPASFPEEYAILQRRWAEAASNQTAT